MYQGPPHFSQLLTSRANTWLMITSCLFLWRQIYFSQVSGEDPGRCERPGMKSGLGQLTSFGELNESLTGRSDRTGCIKRWLEVEKGRDGPCAGWGKAGKPADREESEPLASVRQRWSQRPGREMSSGFLDPFNIFIVVTTVYICISFLVTCLAFPWVCFERGLLLAIRSTRHKTLCSNKNTLPPLKETTNNILQHLLQSRLAFISIVRENIGGWQEPLFFWLCWFITL